MSQRDVLAELRTAQVEAPAQLRARVRLIAAQAPPPRRLTRRRLLLAVPALAAAAAIAVAVVVSTRPSGTHVTHGSVFRAEAQPAPKAAASAPAPPNGRVVRYGASLRLRVAGVSDAVKRALHVTSALGGYPVSVHVATAPHDRAAAAADRTAARTAADAGRRAADRRSHGTRRRAPARRGGDTAGGALRHRPARARLRHAREAHALRAGRAPVARRLRRRRAAAARVAPRPAAARGRAAQEPLICAKTRKVGSPTGSSENSGLTQPSSPPRDA